MNSGGLPIDLILFGMIAAFLVLRLRSVLGKRTGYERPPQTADATAGAGSPTAAPLSTTPAAIVRPIPDPSTPVGAALARMKTMEPSFDPGKFLDGAEQAFRIIVTAFAGGDRATLRSLLADDAYAAFEGAIVSREGAGQTQRTEIRAILSSTVETAGLLDRLATIAVRFVSDQVGETKARDGGYVSGGDAVTEITDLWTFERTLGQPDPTWRLVEARSA